MSPPIAASSAEGATRPETLRQKNGATWWALESDPARDPPKGRDAGRRRPISQVTGQRGGRAAGPAAFFFGLRDDHDGIKNATV